ncbi:MAG: right-handed parallel beta-helix repeat-containing protein, partial [Firmicutes bacterium]|nr:right-handed parallel beta-helix repeat-containing protein [Bacillota bacterium]
MTTYFIDFQNGCDENDGLSPETPFRTQHPELLKPDDTVLFRRGSVFRGPLQNPSGRWEHPIHYGAYGEGEPPVFCGSQSLSDPAQWENVGGSIWRFTGILSGETANLIYGDGTCGALRWTREELCEQGDWFDSCLGYSIQHLPLAEDHTLLVYSQENPAAFYGSIECATSQYRWLAHCGHDMVISDLEFRSNGLHGIAGEEGGRNLRIENCRFAKIGGAVWDKDQKIRFGNAFECWNVAENVEVEHCVFDDIYDSAVTHQGGADCKPAYHFLIRNNTFRRCGMAAYEQRDLLPTYAEFTDNVCEDAGEGFSRLGETMPRRSEIW